MPAILHTLVKPWIVGIFCLALFAAQGVQAAEDDWDFKDPDAYQIPQSMPPAYGGAGYYPYPPQVVPQPAPRKSFLGRLFSPFSRQMSPPIYQPPKVPKEQAKETVALKEPLIRLARTVSFEGQLLPPGFYLLELHVDASGQGATLAVNRQQQTLLRVPAMVQTSETHSTEASHSDLPKPPDQHRKKQDVESNTTALVELSIDGEKVILVYKTEDRHYMSLPLEVVH